MRHGMSWRRQPGQKDHGCPRPASSRNLSPKRSHCAAFAVSLASALVGMPNRAARIVAVLACATLAVQTAAPPAFADYGGQLDSSPRGAQLGYTVRRLQLNSAELVGVLRDVSADNACADIHVWVAIDYAVDPQTNKQICGLGRTTEVIIKTFDPAGYDRVQHIGLKVCRISNGQRSGCVTRQLTTQTF